MAASDDRDADRPPSGGTRSTRAPERGEIDEGGESPDPRRARRDAAVGRDDGRPGAGTGDTRVARGGTSGGARPAGAGEGGGTPGEARALAADAVPSRIDHGRSRRAVPGDEERLVDGLDDHTAEGFAPGVPRAKGEAPHALVGDPTYVGERADLVPNATALAEEEGVARRAAEGRGRLSPIAARRWRAFRANRRGYVSLWIFLALFVVTLFAELVANDRPLLVRHDGALYFPFLVDYPETVFGGDFDTTADYRDPFVAELIEERGWMLWAPIRYAHDTINYDLPVPAPAPPSRENLLGTDDQGRDVLARVIYGFRISVLFGLTLTLLSSLVGIAVGAVQGYLGGWTDLVGQRVIEIWAGLPVLYLLIILASVVEPNFWWLLGLMLLFSWMSLVGVVRAEVLRARNLDYVKAAAALGVGRWTILHRHVLPNAMVATLTFLPFILNGSITTLTSLDFLGFGLPPGSASLGELLAQGKQNLQAPWLGITAFVVLAVMLSLLIFIGEAVRDAFDPRRSGR